MDISHEPAVTECEISHVAARLSSCQHLEQSCSGTSLTSQSVPKKTHPLRYPWYHYWQRPADVSGSIWPRRNWPVNGQRQANLSGRSLTVKDVHFGSFISTSPFQTITADSQRDNSIWITKLFPWDVPLSRQWVPIESCALSLLINNMHDVFFIGTNWESELVLMELPVCSVPILPVSDRNTKQIDGPQQPINFAIYETY